MADEGCKEDKEERATSPRVRNLFADISPILLHEAFLTQLNDVDSPDSVTTTEGYSGNQYTKHSKHEL